MSLAPRSLPHPSLAGRAPRAADPGVDARAVGSVASEQQTSEPTISALGVTWRLTRRSLGDRAPAGASRLLELSVLLEGLDTPRPSASVIAVDPVSRDTLVLEAATPSVSETEVIPDIRSQVHVECPGVLHATVVCSGGQWRLVYARTPVLAALGVPGGRAEPVGVSVRTA